MSKKESQNIEYKESWRDEYLKWICGFANADGGKIYIGINDDGEVVGTDDAKNLLEIIPNKVKDILGIMVEVNLRQKKKEEYIEIIVDAYTYPVNYKGEYHYRSGSTKQVLKGQALNQFLLKKQGKRWDGVPVPGVKITDLKNETFTLFKEKASESKRIKADILNDGRSRIIEDLHLSEGKHLKRAAVLLFHPDPEKFITGAYVKIGFFKSDDDLVFQDEVHGNLFEQIERASELLFTKYIKATISYEGVSRVESYEYPKDAIREALLNAIAHKDYAGENPIQISVYDDKIIFWNEGQLPENWTIDQLKIKHSSKPYNPEIANALSRSGYIEAWGRGTIKMIQECKKAKLPEPMFYFRTSGFVVEFRKDIYAREMLAEKGMADHLIDILLYTKENGSINNTQVQELCSVSKRTATRYLDDLEGLHLIKSGATGKGTHYVLKGSQRGQNSPKDSKSNKGNDIQVSNKQAKNIRKTSGKNTTSKGATKGPKPIQRGHKGAKKSPVKPNKKNTFSKEDLDAKISLLKTEIADADRDNEVQIQFSKDAFFSIYDSWLSELIKSVIIQIRKFDDLFVKPSHHISIKTREHEGMGGQTASVIFNGKNENEIVQETRTAFEKMHMLTADTTVSIHAFYSTFKKGALTQPFGCVYHIKVLFDYIKYEVFAPKFYHGKGFVIDDNVIQHLSSNENYIHVYFDEDGNFYPGGKANHKVESLENGKKIIAEFSREEILRGKVHGRGMIRFGEPRLLHKPFTDDEINELSKEFGNTIFEHIAYYTKLSGLRK